jgi:hypothetical protein
MNKNYIKEFMQDNNIKINQKFYVKDWNNAEWYFTKKYSLKGKLINTAVQKDNKIDVSHANTLLQELLTGTTSIVYIQEHQKDPEEYQLCYADNNLLYFTDNFEDQWGDDWNDAPYEHNAGTPYQYDPNRSDDFNSDAGRIIIAAWYDEYFDTKLPCNDYGNSPYSVQDINAGAIAWLYKRDKEGLMAGATLKEAREFCKNNNILFNVLQ